MRVKKTRIALDGFGGHLGMERGAFVLRSKDGKTKKYPLYESEISEVILKSGNSVTTGALASLCCWRTDVLIFTGNGKCVGAVRNLSDDSHVKTRLAQYKATENHKGAYVAKKLVQKKIEGQNQLLRKYGLRQLGYENVNALKESDIVTLRRKLMQIESKASQKYFRELYSLFPEPLRPKRRRGFHAYDGINNLFNLAYELLKWRVHISLLKSHLEPYLGFLHSQQHGKPSLVCDFEELYRYLIDDFVVQYCRNLRKKDFIFKTEKYVDKKGKREYLKDSKTSEFTKKLNEYFLTTVAIPRVKIGKWQEIETLINEEALLLAKYLRGERKEWVPRIANLT